MWTLKYNDVTKTLAEWRISGMVRRRLSLDKSTVAFDLSADVDADDVFAYGSTVTIYREGVQWFVGRVDQTPRTANGRYEGHGYVLVDAWWYLENLVYQVAWKELTNRLDPAEGTTEKLYSHLVLNLTTTGLIITTKAQITAALEYAIEAGAPFQLGSLELPDVYPPTSEVQDITCTEVVQRQLRWTPDAVGYFDYSTTHPTLHIKQRSALTRVTVPMTDCTELQIRPRYDLQVPAVVIKYRRTNMVNGVAYYEQALDAMPEDATGKEFRSIVTTIDLEGSQMNFSSAQIVCETIAETTTAFWQRHYPPLASEAVNPASLTVQNPTRESSLPRELVSGTVPGWLLAKEIAQAERDNIKVLASYEQMDGATVQEKRIDRELHTEIIATNLVTGSYLNSLSVSFGQPAPMGLANYLYLATSRLQFDGSFVLSEEECAGTVGLGQMLCVSGARAEYTEMDAVVQSITESIEDGKTTVVFGPPKHLGADDIIEFLQATRNRVRFTPTNALTSGLSAGANSGAAPKEAPIKNSNADGGKIERMMIGSTVAMDVTNVPSVAAAGRALNLRFRVIPYCDNGVERKICVLASEVFSGEAEVDIS